MLIALLCLWSPLLRAQTKDTSGLSSVEDMDLLFSELDDFLDSLLKPRSFTVLGLNAGNRLYNRQQAGSVDLRSERLFTLSPSFGYYDASGLGFGLNGQVVQEPDKWQPFQLSATLSYDYIRNRKFVTGISYSRFFTKDSLTFYTSPISNEAYFHFTWRDLPVRPSVALSYGWGSRTSYTEREGYIKALRLKRRGSTIVTTTENVSDLNLTTSLRKDFYFLKVLRPKDHFRITPQISLLSGTQKYGLNQTTSAYGRKGNAPYTLLYNSEETSLSGSSDFRPLSLTALLKAEYSIGKFYLQPQALLDYYFPAKEQSLSSAFSVSAGVIF